MASCSDGIKIEKPKLSQKYQIKIKKINKLKKLYNSKKLLLKNEKTKQPKSKQEKNLKAKIENYKLDYIHKESTKIVNKSSIIVSNQIPTKRKKIDKKLNYLSLGTLSKPFQNMLCYKAIRAGRTFKVIPEKDLIWAFSKCCTNQTRTNYRIRVWKCKECGKVHDFTTNTYNKLLSVFKNTLRIGHDTPNSV